MSGDKKESDSRTPKSQNQRPHIFREYVLQRFQLSPGPCIDIIRFRFENLLWLGEHLSAFARHLCFFLEFFLSVPVRPWRGMCTSASRDRLRDRVRVFLEIIKMNKRECKLHEMTYQGFYSIYVLWRYLWLWSVSIHYFIQVVIRVNVVEQFKMEYREVRLALWKIPSLQRRKPCTKVSLVASWELFSIASQGVTPQHTAARSPCSRVQPMSWLLSSVGDLLPACYLVRGISFCWIVTHFY